MSAVLVTGATGKQGGATVRALLAKGVPVRALVRDPNKTAGLDGAEIVVGDLRDPGSLVAAAKGTRAVFSVQMPAFSETGPDFEGEEKQAANLIEAALTAGVPQFVQTTVMGAGAHNADRWPMIARSLGTKAAIQDRVRAAGFERWTLLKPGFFMENFLPGIPFLFPRGLDGGLVSVLKPRTKLALVATRDIGAAAAMAFVDPDRFHQVELELAGDYRSMTEIAEGLSRAFGRPLPAPDMTEEQALAAGMPPMAAGHDWLNVEDMPGRPEHARALGIAVTSFEEWLLDQA